MEGLDIALNHRVPFRIRSLQQRIERMPAQRKRWVKRQRALQRHGIWKITLVDTLFNLLDLLNVGALGSHERVQFALLTGFQGYRGTLHDHVKHLLDTWGSTHGSRFFTNKINMLYFRQKVSRTGPLAMTKAELRRTIRYAKAMELELPGPLVQHGPTRWRSLKHMQIPREAQQWKQGIVWHRYDPSFLPFPNRSSAAALSSEDTPGASPGHATG